MGSAAPSPRQLWCRHPQGYSPMPRCNTSIRALNELMHSAHSLQRTAVLLPIIMKGSRRRPGNHAAHLPRRWAAEGTADESSSLCGQPPRALSGQDSH